MFTKSGRISPSSKYVMVLGDDVVKKRTAHYGLFSISFLTASMMYAVMDLPVFSAAVWISVFTSGGINKEILAYFSLLYFWLYLIFCSYHAITAPPFVLWPLCYETL